jgi:hypothetical protein
MFRWEVNAKPFPEIAKPHGLRAQTTYARRKLFDAQEPADATRRSPRKSTRFKSRVRSRQTGSLTCPAFFEPAEA